MADPSLAAFLVAVFLVAAAAGAYIGIKRARAPLGAPEPQVTIDRRQRFRPEHLGQARMAVIVTAALVLAATVWLTAAHA